MKTSKNVVVNRFGRLLSGILSAAMVFSAAAFQTPVSASDENGGYEVLYDFGTEYTPDNANITKSDNLIDVKTIGGTTAVKAILSDEVAEKTVGKKVRWHYDFMWDAGTSAKIAFRNLAYEGTSENDLLRLGLTHFKKRAQETDPYEGYIAYGTGVKNDYSYNEANRVTNPSEFLGSQWYSVDTVYDLGNDKVSYYIDSEKVGETSLNGFSKIKMLRITTHEWLDSVYYGQGTMHFKNMKLDTGLAANVLDTDDEGAVVKFTMPTELNESDVTVKCLETGETPSVTVQKINEFTYKVKYPMGTNIGGDYLLSFSDAFAAINGLSDKNVAYSQNPSPSYNYYLNDDFESYVPEDNFDNAWESNFWKKNPTVSTDKIKDVSSSTAGYTNYTVYTVNDTVNKMMKVDLSRCAVGNAANDTVITGYRYALDGFTTSQNINNTSTSAVKGKIKLSFDVKNVDEPNEGVTASDINRFVVRTNPYWQKLIAMNKNTLYIYGNQSDYGEVNKIKETVELGETSNGFHKIEVLFDFDNDNQKVYADGIERASYKIYNGLKNNGLTWLEFVQGKSEWTQTGVEQSKIDYYGKLYTLMDNLKITDENPMISGIKSVQYSNDGENYSPAIDKVDAETKYVKIDFASAMDASTLDNIKLSNGSAAVAATGAASSDNKTYTLTLNENLATSTEYTLNIPQTVTTSDGAALAREYNGKIMTTAGVFRVDLFDIQKNGESVQKSDIVKGDTVNAVVNITNTEGRVGTAYVCVCVYNNNVMTQVNFLPIDLATESTKSVPLNINSVDGLKIKAFLWNSFEKMQPIVPNKTVE